MLQENYASLKPTIDYSSAVDKLRTSFSTNATKCFEWRKTQLLAIRRLCTENEDKIAEALSIDLGRGKMENIAMEMVGILTEIDHNLANLKSWMKPEYVRVPTLLEPATSELQSEPYGVCLVMGSFNFPFSLLLIPVIGAIIAGNCCVIKPSEVPAACDKLLNYLLPKYLDMKYFFVVSGGIAETTELLKVRFDKIFFTGSTRVGKVVMKAAAEFLTPVALELGGKSPTIVDESVTDLELAVKRIMWGKCSNAGQICISPDHVNSHEKINDAV
jgi:aldehyde dehydrogenase (NAD+)